MQRHDENGWWEWEPSEAGEMATINGEPGDYMLVGSIPLTTWELTVLTAQGVSGLIDLEMEYLR